MGIQDLKNLSLPEKILLVEQLWDSIAEDASKNPLPEWKKELLENRLSEHKKTPTSGSTWEVVKKKYYDR